MFFKGEVLFTHNVFGTCVLYTGDISDSIEFCGHKFLPTREVDFLSAKFFTNLCGYKVDDHEIIL